MVESCNLSIGGLLAQDAAGWPAWQSLEQQKHNNRDDRDDDRRLHKSFG